MQLLSESLFSVYALALSQGHGFGSRPPKDTWTTADHIACGVLRRDETDGSFGLLVMRRRVDHVWAVTAD